VEIDFQKSGGLVPAIIQDERSGDVLMLGFMNPESLAKRDAQEKLCSSAAHETSCGRKANRAATLARAQLTGGFVTPMRSLCVSKLPAPASVTRVTEAVSPLDRTRWKRKNNRRAYLRPGKVYGKEKPDEPAEAGNPKGSLQEATLDLSSRRAGWKDHAGFHEVRSRD